MDIIFLPLSDFYLLNFVIVVLLGLVLGSFASALVYRIPRNISWVRKTPVDAGDSSRQISQQIRSSCPSCDHVLGWFDLVPVFSWLCMGGRCRYCRTDISIVYPICELLTLSGCLGVFFVFGFSVSVFPLLLLMPFLSALILIDYKYMILPNQLVLIGLVLGFVHLAMKCLAPNALIYSVLIEYIGGFFLYGGFAWLLFWLMPKILKKEALGFGDVKLFFVVGLWCGASVFGVYVMLAGALGVLFALLLRVLKGEGGIFPFGPALIVSMYFLVLFHDVKLLPSF